MYLIGKDKMTIELQKNKKCFKNTKRGVTLYVAIVVTSALLLVSFAIANVTFKQASLASINKDSHLAFFAADSGAECALYWDLKNPTGGSAFSTSTVSQISCNYDGIQNADNENMQVGGLTTSEFNITFNPEPYCTKVTVTKAYQGGNLTTKIESRGYNTCDSSNPRRVERAVRIEY